jgi:hypothetical protein
VYKLQSSRDSEGVCDLEEGKAERIEIYFESNFDVMKTVVCFLIG